MQFKVQLYYTVMDEDYDIRHISGVAGKKSVAEAHLLMYVIRVQLYATSGRRTRFLSFLPTYFSFARLCFTPFGGP